MILFSKPLAGARNEPVYAPPLEDPSFRPRRAGQGAVGRENVEAKGGGGGEEGFRTPITIDLEGGKLDSSYKGTVGRESASARLKEMLATVFSPIARRSPSYESP